MPWDDVTLSILDLTDAESEPTVVAGGNDESVSQPQWDDEGNLFFVSDRTDFWNIYKYDGESVESVIVTMHDLVPPNWMFGKSSYVLHNNLIYHVRGGAMYTYSLLSNEAVRLDTLNEYTSFSNLVICDDVLYFIGSSPSLASEVVSLDLSSESSASVRVLRKSSQRR